MHPGKLNINTVKLKCGQCAKDIGGEVKIIGMARGVIAAALLFFNVYSQTDQSDDLARPLMFLPLESTEIP